MTDAGFFRGTSAEQDNRFSDKEKKLMKQMRFGENVTKKVDMTKVKIDVLRPWISKRIEDLLGMEDDVIEEFVVNQLEADQHPDGRRIQINLTGFLNGKNARIFTAELWDMLLSAQEQSTGIPASLIESKQEEIRKRNEEQEKEKQMNDTLKRTVSRFVDKLKIEPDSSSSKSAPATSSDKLPSSSSSSALPNIKREKTSPDSNSTREVDFSRRKDDGGRRQYRSRRTSSPSPRRESRSRSRSRDRGRREKDRLDRDRDRDRGRDRRDRVRDRSLERERRRGRDRSRSPIDKIRRSPLLSRDSRSQRSRERERSSGGLGTSRRYSDQHDRNRDRNNRSSLDQLRDRDRERDRRRSRSRSVEDSNKRRRGGDEEDYAQNGSNFRQPLSASPRRESKDRAYSKERDRGREDEERMAVERRVSTERSSEVQKTGRKMTPPDEEEEAEASRSDRSNANESDEDVQKKARKEKKSKKDKKKHRKHKKSKKSKKSKNGGAINSDAESDGRGGKGRSEEESGSESDGRGSADEEDTTPAYLKGSLYHQTSEDLERKLRERALESLKKATSSH